MKTLLFVCFIAAANCATYSTYFQTNGFGSNSFGSNGFGINSFGSNDFGSNDLELQTSIRNYVKAQKMQELYSAFEQICPGHRQEFQNALEESKTCANGIDEKSETACSIVRNHLRRCLAPVTDLLEKCLPEKSESIPSTIVEALESASEFLCKTDGEHVFELSNTCALTYDITLRRCERVLKTKVQRYTKESPSKNDVCDFFQSFKPCFYTHINNNCGNEITRQTWIGFYDALGAPCTKSVENSAENKIPDEDEYVDIELI